MSSESTSARRAVWAGSVVVAWWLGVGLLSRANGPSVDAWTERLFTFGLALTYLACWFGVSGSPASASSGSSPWAVPRPIQLRAIGTSLVLVVLVALLELPAAFGLVSYAGLVETTAVTDAFIADAALSFRRPPGAAWTGPVRSDLTSSWNVPLAPPKTISFTTDTQGFRNVDDPQRADLALIGDSYVEGWYVSDDATVASVLERRLRRPVANLAVSGYGTLQQLEVLRRYALPARPRLVAWFFFEGNDLYDDQSFEDTMLYLEDHDVEDLGFDIGLGFDWPRFRRASLVRNAQRWLRRTTHPLIPQPLPPHGWFLDDTGARHLLAYHDYAALTFTEYEADRFAVTQRAFREGIALGRDSGAVVVPIFVPMKFRVYGDHCTFTAESPCRQWQPWDLPERFNAFCADEGLRCVDLTPLMQAEAAAGRLLYAPEDSHWNEAGHQFVAAQLDALWQRLNLGAP